MNQQREDALAVVKQEQRAHALLQEEMEREKRESERLVADCERRLDREALTTTPSLSPSLELGGREECSARYREH